MRGFSQQTDDTFLSKSGVGRDGCGRVSTADEGMYERVHSADEGEGTYRGRHTVDYGRWHYLRHCRRG